MSRAIDWLPMTVRTTMALARASVGTLRALVLVTALMPMVPVAMVTLAVRKAGARNRRARERARE